MIARFNVSFAASLEDKTISQTNDTDENGIYRRNRKKKYTNATNRGITPLYALWKEKRLFFETFVNRENNWALTLVLRFYDRNIPCFDW